MHICDRDTRADTLAYTLSIRFLLPIKTYYFSYICYLFIFAVAIKIAAGIVYVSVGCHCKLPVSQ